MHLTHRLAAGVLAASLVAGGAGSVFAKGTVKGQNAGKPVAYGQVSGITSTGFTLTSIKRAKKNGQAPAPVLVSTTGAKLKARKGETGAFANGDYALVFGTKTAAGITATRVRFSATAFRQLIQRAVGTVVSNGATSLTIQTKAQKRANVPARTLTFAITTNTHFRVNGQKATTAPTLTQGEKVRVAYRTNAATNSLVARAIIIRTAAA